MKYTSGISKARHINIPVFIPHEGCPNDCVFCNQHSITSHHADEFSRANRDIRPEIDAALSTIDLSDPDTEVEIAFFGGSFTGIDRGVMVRLLEDAHSYISKGDVRSIRLSTRPDFIDGEILEILSRFGVRHIELGIQSMNDGVLAVSKRGHTSAQTERACKLIVEAGFSLTGQMMIGLPCSTVEDEIFTARKICEMGASSARIYPTVVFYDTALCGMAKDGRYTPLTDDEGAYRAALCMRVFEEHGVKLLRVGLQSGEGLSADRVYAGACHSAMGEMAAGELYFMKMSEMLGSKAAGLSKNERYELTVLCPDGEISKVSGHKKRNKERLAAFLSDMGINVSEIKIKACENADGFDFEFRSVGDIIRRKKKVKKLHITNGTFFNEHFEKVTGLKGIPFNEAMMTGKTVPGILSEEFFRLRAEYHGVSENEYAKKLSPFAKAMEKLTGYDEIHLYFGKDAFCICNMITVLALLEQKDYSGKVLVNYIDDEDFSGFSRESADKPAKEIVLGVYNEIYNCVLVGGKFCKCGDADISGGINLYFDFHSKDGKLARIVKESTVTDKNELLIKLLQNSKEYGMSDIQGTELIDKIRG